MTKFLQLLYLLVAQNGSKTFNVCMHVSRRASSQVYMRARFVRACVHAEHREREGQPACPRHSHAEHLLLYPKVHALEKPTRAMPRSGEPQKLVAAAVEDPVHHKQQNSQDGRAQELLCGIFTSRCRLPGFFHPSHFW